MLQLICCANQGNCIYFQGIIVNLVNQLALLANHIAWLSKVAQASVVAALRVTGPEGTFLLLWIKLIYHQPELLSVISHYTKSQELCDGGSRRTPTYIIALICLTCLTWNEINTVNSNTFHGFLLVVCLTCLTYVTKNMSHDKVHVFLILLWVWDPYICTEVLIQNCNQVSVLSIDYPFFNHVDIG